MKLLKMGRLSTGTKAELTTLTSGQKSTAFLSVGTKSRDNFRYASLKFLSFSKSVSEVNWAANCCLSGVVFYSERGGAWVS